MTPRKEPPAPGTRGRVIYDARLRLGISQAELARRIGTARRNVLRWENNQVRPGPDYSESLADELGVPIETILDAAVAHVRRSQDQRVNALLRETALLRAEIAELRRQLREAQRSALRVVS